MSEGKIITDLHRKTLDAAFETINKHFDSCLILVSVSNNAMTKEQTTFRRSGGYVQSLGLIEEYKMEMQAGHTADELESRKDDP